MMLLSHCRLPLGLALLGLGFFLTSVSAQTKAIKAGEGRETLIPEKDYTRDNEELKAMAAMRRGERAFSDADKPMIDRVAQWLTFRLTQNAHQEPKLGVKGMSELRREATDAVAVDLRKASGSQAAYAEELGKRMVARLHEVVKNPRRIARLNAAILLADLCKLGHEEAADVLAEVLDDPAENDGIKLWAARGLKDLFALTRGPANYTFRNKEREQRAVQSLISYVTRKVEPAKDADEKELIALSLVRAEAVAALGQTRFPALAKTVNKQTTIERPTALYLLKLLRKDGVTLQPTVYEQVQAAIAVCQLDPKTVEAYNLDYALYNVGQFLVDFAAEYNKSKTAEEKSTERWKHDALRLLYSLNELKNETVGSTHGNYTAKMVEQAAPMLEQIIDGKQSSADPLKLASWLEQNKPQSTSLFKGKADAVVTAPAPTEK